MNESLQSLSTFHLAGEKPGKDFADIGQLGLRPALFSAYQDLAKLRHDYPLVLINGENKETVMQSLSDLIDDTLREIAPPGIEGEQLRKHVLGLEEEIRTLVDQGNKGTLLQLWDMAETNRLSRTDEAGRKSLGDNLSRARTALGVDGELVGCDGEAPAKVLTHAWTSVQENKARGFAKEIGELTVKLSNILKADTMRSEKAFGAEALKRSMGSVYEAAFDFEAMSDILGPVFVNGAVPKKRQRRIRAALSVLKSQRFFDTDEDGSKKSRNKGVHGFVFNRPTRALEAFQERLPEMVDLFKAVTIAELEIEGRYNEKTHDPFFQRFDEKFLEPDDLARFPSYLICLQNGACAKAEKVMLTEVLSSGLPMKILVQSDDILDEQSITSGRFSFGLRGSQLAAMTVGLNNTYVLQSSGSAIYRKLDSILGGLKNGQPALFSIFSGLAGTSPGSVKNSPDTQPYLRAAAAMESRAFPAFVFDPARGDDWALRFSVTENPQAGAEWPVHHFCYEDEDLQKISQNIAFTFVDFVATDERYGKYFAAVPRSKWRDEMVSVEAFLKLDTEASAEKVPYILMVDENNTLHKVIVDVKLVEAAHRCLQMWRNLQELGGIDNSYARIQLAKEKEIWEQEKERELEALKCRLEPGTEEIVPTSDAEMPEVEVPLTVEEPVVAEVASDEPYIETLRCTTCDECTEINNKMFAYDDNMQAFIADPDAGTFHQLIEAAESCQVAIIHPGKPRNQNETNLDDLMARAEPFN